MPRYYCDYCDTYLTHDSPSVRKQHNAGYKHKANVRSYYQQFEEQQTQSLIDQRIKEHLGAFQHQVGATFNQHMMSLPPNSQGPRLPILPPPMLPIGASQPPAGPPLLPGVRPAGLPFPVVNAPGYNVPPPMAPPGAPSSHMQLNSLPRPPTVAPLSAIGAAMPIPNGSGSMANPVIYQANPLPSTSGGFNALSTPDASGLQSSATGVSQSYARISEAGH